MMHLATFVICLVGFAALAFATDRQQEIVFGRVLNTKSTRYLQLAGWGALILALVVAVRAWGWAYGLVVYSGHTSLCAGLIYVVLLLTAQRRKTGRQS